MASRYELIVANEFMMKPSLKKKISDAYCKDLNQISEIMRSSNDIVMRYSGSNLAERKNTNEH